ncbi:MAG: hypothetical protein ACREQY_01680 [Candidatus Binatia bacterium]
MWSFLWASAILFSLVSTPSWFVLLVSSFPSSLWFREVAACALALLVMLRPGSIPLLGALAIAQIVQSFAWLPEVANHRLITAFINVSLSIAIVGACRAERTARPSASALWEGFLPGARWLLLIVYFFAFFAKLNGDFFDPHSSCAGQFYGKIAYWLPLLPHGERILAAVAWTTLVVEGALPLLLAIPRFRTWGVALGLAFHLALAFDLLQHLVNFSAMMAALLVLFLPDRPFAALSERWRALAGESVGPGMLRIVACVAFLALVVVALRAVESDAFAIPYYALRQVMFVALVGALLAYVVAFRDETTAAPALPLPRSLLQGVVLALAVVNGLSPYVGLKTRTAFNMYSNLRVEAEGSNHFLVPRSFDLLGILSDTVTVLRTNDAQLSSQAARYGSRITWFEFTSYVNRNREIEVWYDRGGTLHYLNARTGGGMPPAPPWLLRRLLFFRPIGGRGARECLW